MSVRTRRPKFAYKQKKGHSSLIETSADHCDDDNDAGDDDDDELMRSNDDNHRYQRRDRLNFLVIARST